MQAQFYVYKVTNKINNKIYIGKASDPEVRWKKHLYTVKYGEKKYGFSYIHAAIRKYGVENFLFEIIGTYPSENEAFSAEIYYIAKFKSKDRNFGYNLTEGGEGVSGRKQTEEEKLQKLIYMIDFWSKNPHPSKGTSLTEDHKKAISESNRKKVQPPEVREKISLANSGKNNGMYGRSEGIESRKARGAKISETKINNPTSPQVVSEDTINKLKVAVRENKSRELKDEQKDLIVELYGTGKYIKRDLAIQFDTEEKTIQYVLRYWQEVKNNKSKYLTMEQKESIMSLYLSTQYTRQQISDKTKIPFNRVEAVIRMYQNKMHK